jgi:hypothetical protein
MKINVLPEWLDQLMRGWIKDDRRYLGNDGWQRVNVEESRLNERKASSVPSVSDSSNATGVSTK